MAGPVTGFLTGALNRYAEVSAGKRQQQQQVELTRERQVPQMRQLELQEEKFDYQQEMGKLDQEYRELQDKLKQERLDKQEELALQQRKEDIALARERMANELEKAKIYAGRGRTPEEISAEEPSTGKKVLGAMAGMLFPGEPQVSGKGAVEQLIEAAKGRKAIGKAAEELRQQAPTLADDAAESHPGVVSPEGFEERVLRGVSQYDLSMGAAVDNVVAEDYLGYLLQNAQSPIPQEIRAQIDANAPNYISAEDANHFITTTTKSGPIFGESEGTISFADFLLRLISVGYGPEDITQIFQRIYLQYKGTGEMGVGAERLPGGASYGSAVQSGKFSPWGYQGVRGK